MALKTAARAITDSLALKTAVLAPMEALALKSPAITQPPHICLDGLLPLRSLGELTLPFSDEARQHRLILEGSIHG